MMVFDVALDGGHVKEQHLCHGFLDIQLSIGVELGLCQDSKPPLR